MHVEERCARKEIFGVLAMVCVCCDAQTHTPMTGTFWCGECVCVRVCVTMLCVCEIGVCVCVFLCDCVRCCVGLRC